MALFFENFVVDIIFVIITLFTSVYIYFMYCYTYWVKRNVPYLPPNFPYGNCKTLNSEGVHFNTYTRHYYNAVRDKGLKYAGIYLMSNPVLVLRDPEYIKDILTKDFENFPNRTVYYNEEDDPISAHLFAIRDQKWRNLRIKLTPTFTSGKLKAIFPIMTSLSNNLIIALEKVAAEGKDVDILDFSGKYTTDVICNVAFGLEPNTFENPDTEFRRMVMKLGDIDGIINYIQSLIIGRYKNLARKLRLVGTRKDVSDYFFSMIEKTVKYRKENNIKRPDFLQTLTELMETSANSENPFTWEQLVSQSFLFFFAGFDTSATTMLFTFYELSRNKDIQDKVRGEIESVLEKYNGELTYEALKDLVYLQQVIDESLRLYPPVATLDRVCAKEYKLKNSDGIIGKGITTLVSIIGLHRDPEYYPNPEIFDPERFNAENIKLRHPYLHLPFGEGSRNCIGLRFGLLQTKIGIVNVIRKFKLTLSPSTKSIEFDDQSFFLKPIHPIYLKVEKL